MVIAATPSRNPFLIPNRHPSITLLARRLSRLYIRFLSCHLAMTRHYCLTTCTVVLIVLFAALYFSPEDVGRLSVWYWPGFRHVCTFSGEIGGQALRSPPLMLYPLVASILNV
jgi:hypothetical protein